MIRKCTFGLALCMVMLIGTAYGESYPIVDTGQTLCFNNSRQMKCPKQGVNFNGQDAQYKGNQALYRDNGDGTVTDLVTGLMWVRARGEKVSWNEAMRGARECRVGGYNDWRAPTIKELYSLMDFKGWGQPTKAGSIPFLDTRYFGFKYGDESRGERIIDCQDWSSTQYVSKTMGGNMTAFGVNFADGRIKGYGTKQRRQQDKKYIRYVRGNAEYGKNEFKDNGNGTVYDKATTLMWQKTDSVKKFKWEQALSYCENLDMGGRSDWRLPSAKELQSIVDYARSPMTSNSAAIDPVFSVTDRESYFWTSTTHMDGPKPTNAVYVAFGRAMGYFAPPGSSASKQLMDVHGAGAQRSDPKANGVSKLSTGSAPQGDDIRIENYARCVAGGGVEYYEPPFSRMPQWQGKGNPNVMKSGNQSRKMGSMPSGMGQGMGRESGQGRMQRPPREAYTACAGKTERAKCSFEAPHGTISGMCADIGGDVVCVPEGRPAGGRPPMQ